MNTVLMMHLVQFMSVLVQGTTRRTPYQIIPNRRGLSVHLQQPQRGEHRIPHSKDLLSGPSRRSPLPPASQDNKEDVSSDLLLYQCPFY
jgi:hypothetical protein